MCSVLKSLGVNLKTYNPRPPRCGHHCLTFVCSGRDQLHQSYSAHDTSSGYLNLTLCLLMYGGEGCVLQTASVEHNTEVCFTAPHPSFIDPPPLLQPHLRALTECN